MLWEEHEGQGRHNYIYTPRIMKCVRNKAAISGESCRRGAVFSLLNHIEQNETGILREEPKNKKDVADEWLLVSEEKGCQEQREAKT